MSAEKYPIEATCQECKEDVWVNKGKDSGIEYLTDSKNVRGEKPNFHGCFTNKWKPRVTSSGFVPEKSDQTKISADDPMAGQSVATQRDNELLKEEITQEPFYGTRHKPEPEFETAENPIQIQTSKGVKIIITIEVIPDA